MKSIRRKINEGIKKRSYLLRGRRERFDKSSDNRAYFGVVVIEMFGESAEQDDERLSQRIVALNIGSVVEQLFEFR